MPMQQPSRLGQTIAHGGHTYELQAVSGGAHRWVRLDRQQADQPGGEQTATAANVAAGGAAPQTGPDPSARHEFTKSQLASVSGPIRGVMAAMHAHPEAQSSGSIVSQAFAPNQARQVHTWLSQNVGQHVAGGQVVDLGQGRMGFASPAGSIIVWPADSSGKHQIKYTNQTGPVARAMGGSEATPGVPATSPPSPGQGATAAPSGSGENPFAPPKGEFVPGGQGKPMTAAAAQAAGGIMEPPGTKPREGGPRTAREIANATKQQLQDATERWQQELSSGLTPKGNARWRSYLAALNSIHGHQEKLARAEERGQKVQGEQGGDDELKQMERRISEHDPHALQQIKDFTNRPDSYRDLVQQYHDKLYPELASQRAANNPAARKEPLFEPGAKEPTAEHAAMSRMGIDPATGQPPAKPSRREIENRMREEARSGFSTESQEQPPESKLPRRQQKLVGLMGKYFEHFGVAPSEQNRGALQKAIEAGQISHPRDLRTVLRTAAKIHGRTNKTGDTSADDHAAIKESIRRKANRESRQSYQAIVKKQAEEWDMKPAEYHKLAEEVYPEFAKHYQEREAAKEHARRVTGLSAREINQMENQGLDSATAKRFDEIGRELASEHPGIFGGEGYGDEASTDYGAKLWDLIKEGAKRPPGKASPEFHNHLDEFLRAQLRGGSSGISGGHAAEGDEASAVPFARIRSGIVTRYRRYLTMSPVGDLPALRAH